MTSKEIKGITTVNDGASMNSAGNIGSPMHNSGPLTADGSQRKMNIQLILKEKDKEIQRYAYELNMLKN